MTWLTPKTEANEIGAVIRIYKFEATSRAAYFKETCDETKTQFGERSILKSSHGESRLEIVRSLRKNLFRYFADAEVN